MSEQAQIRIRVNVATSVKGIHTPDYTVELIWPYDKAGALGHNAEVMKQASDMVLAESARVGEILDAKYGNQWTNGKE